MMDCVFVSGVGNPAYQFSDNVLVAGWTDSKDSLYPVDPSALASAYSGLDITISQPIFCRERGCRAIKAKVRVGITASVG